MAFRIQVPGESRIKTGSISNLPTHISKIKTLLDIQLILGPVIPMDNPTVP
jgi:hypothetical protein